MWFIQHISSHKLLKLPLETGFYLDSITKTPFSLTVDSVIELLFHVTFLVQHTLTDQILLTLRYDELISIIIVVVTLCL